MKNKTIYIIRHGKPSGNLKLYLGQNNPSLSKLGIRQIEYWWKYFLNIKIDKIYTSNLIRAIQTARIISKGRPLEVEHVPEIKEIDLGQWDGMEFEVIRKKYPISFRIRGANLEYYRPPNGESFSDLENRVIPAFNKIIEVTNHKSIVISHAGVNRVIIANIMKIPISKIFRIKQDYGALNKIIITPSKKIIVYYNRKPLLFKR